MKPSGLSRIQWSGRLLSVAFLIALSGCLSTSPEPEAQGSADAPVEQMGNDGIRFSPNVRIGEIVWINERGDFAVVRMDAPSPAFQPAFLLASDPTGNQRPGVLVGGGQVEGRSFGARIVEGPVPEGAEVRIPGPEWTEYLYNRYNRTERLPPPGGR